MQLHEIKPKTYSRESRRIGRGGKRGTTSGRGTKGQKARAGHKIRPAIRDIIKKLPKRRGYRFRVFKSKPIAVNVARILKYFPEGATIDPAALIKARLVRRIKGNAPKIKILGKLGGVGKKKFVFKDVELSREVKSGE